MRYLNLVLLLFWINTLFSQQLKLSIKTGAANSLAAPLAIHQGFAYKTVSSSFLRPSIGLELGCERESMYRIIGGVVLSPVSSSFDFNSRNIDLSQSYSPVLIAYDYNVQLYVGIEKKMLKNSAPQYKNYFSLVGGIGLNYFYYKSDETGLYTVSYGKTKSGETLSGMDVGITHNIFGAPSVFGGIRYNITNTKGERVVILELLVNHGLVKYFDWRIKYQIDSQERIDYLPEKGFNIQFNVIVPLFNFSKSKKQR